MKSKIAFVCQECGYESPKFMGKCPECGEWNTLREFKVQNTAFKNDSPLNKFDSKDLTAKKLSDIVYEDNKRLSTGFSEMDAVLGGGIVKGSATLLAGDPGIGKSTLLLQMGLNLSKTKKVLYVSGEESEEQIKMRSSRISKDSRNNNMFVVSLNNTDRAVGVIEDLKPDIVIVDSIQTMESENLSGLSGSVGQVRYGALSFIKLAKTLGMPVILVGHVTKEGMVAGPMVLSHMVDTLLFFEGEKFTQTRILRSLKNRFGPVDEVGIFAMAEYGLSQIDNAEHLFMSSDNLKTPGSVLTVAMEGTRPFLVEIQALTVFSKFPMPRRVANGIDGRRLELLIAVLQKQARLPLDTMDIFVNITGGFKMSDPASDLAVCLAIFSSFKNLPLSKTVSISEVGLLGELRAAPFYEKRVRQAQKLGFKKVLSGKTYKTLQDVIKSFSGQIKE
ncbi:MAG: DNA repair protein RadA [Patescibacteria group bacterium]